jgi:septum formation protein
LATGVTIVVHASRIPPMTRIVLGSASPGRLTVLRQAGIEPFVIVSGVDEDAIIGRLDGAPPSAVVNALAAAKADAVARELPADIGTDCVVIGCDSMLFRDGLLCGKPATGAAAAAAWASMSGRTGELHTGHAVLRVRDGVTVHREVECASTTVYFGTPSEDELVAYVGSGEPLRVAGAFTLDGLGGWFVDRIDGDPSNVIGLSLPLTRRLLARAGLSIATLWAANPGGRRTPRL